MFYEKTKTGLKLFVRVTPKASANKLQISDDVLKVYVTSVPEDGKANKAVIELLAKRLHVAKSSVQIVQGEISRNKTVVIEGDVEELEKKIQGELK